MGVTEEHALPSQNDPDTRFRFIADGVMEGKIPGLLDRVRAIICNKMASVRGDRGPDPDIDPSVEAMRSLERAILSQRRYAPQNGDSGPEKQWPTVLSACGIMITLLGVGYAFVEKQATMENKIDNVIRTQVQQNEQRSNDRAETLELIRATNERINRLEDRTARSP